MKLIDKILGDPNIKVIKQIRPIVDKINSLEDGIKKKSDSELKEKTLFFQTAAKEKNGEELRKYLDDILPEAFAIVREAAKRVLKQRHYDVQLIGGIVLHQGKIAEMKTGEGKTLVATLPLYLNALAGRSVHLVTVNDYWASIGAGWMAPVFHFLGLSTGVIIHETGLIYDPEYSDDSQYDDRLKNFRKVERKDAYNADILYGTNNEFGFDYLRDNMVPSLERMSQRELFYAIVDEIDSILIDEARTPLIISAPAEESTDKYNKFFQLIRQLKENEDYNVDEKMRAATLSESGISKMEKLLGVDNIYTTGGVREVHHIEQALKAHALFKLDRDYVVKDGEVIIVDEFTGRLMHGRRYSEGLHQAIEAKEGVNVQRESQTLATITFQNYFRMYNKLSGMTGTAATEAEEFAKIYSLDTVIIPTNKPSQRIDKNDLIYRSEEGKFKAVIEEVKKRSQTGQPVLVGTVSIEKNEILANMMEREGLKPQVLNAKNHEKEARFIAQAGSPGTITIATNMAGRGVDIILGGSEAEKSEQEKVKKFGGLHVIGTERHEARRIDNQLRGRAGRQGDPGSSRFFVSMDDDLMRIFGGDRMKSIMDTLKVPEDMPIENKMISRSIESAQQKVEGNNFDIRKHLVEYDDVINKHRESIYKKRKNILEIGESEKNLDLSRENDQDEALEKSSFFKASAGKKAQISKPGPKDELIPKTLSGIILENIELEIEQLISFHTASDEIKSWDLNEIKQAVSTIFPVKEDLKTDLKKYTGENNKIDKAKARTDIIEYLVELAKENYKKMAGRAEELGINWLEIEKSILIRSIDTLWVEHLEAMASVRQGIGLRGYGQRDPLVEYKKEAYRLYNELNSLIQKEVAYSIFKLGRIEDAQTQEFKAPSLVDRAKQFSAPSKVMDQSTTSFSGYKSPDNGAQGDSGAKDIVREKVKDESGKKVGRNDPCPCGSGKKYKKCCGA
ncbi:preprotein translocase subunit SecA [Candidatus Falkowbacteria bacterium]|nr:MAG: preprotein translocase subunit SecA [Candidatus Falkowbacteria bacterium]